MKKVINKSLAVSCVGALLVSQAYAAELSYSVYSDYENNKIVISGTADEATDAVTLQILKQNIDIKNLKADENYYNSIIYTGQNEVENGQFSFEVGYTEDLTPGIYAGYIVDGFGSKTTVSGIAITTSKAYKDAVTEINASAKAGNVSDFYAFLTGNDKDGAPNSLKLGFDVSLLKKLSASDILGYMNYVAKNPLTHTESVKNINVFNTFVLAEAVSGGIVDNANDYLKETTIKESSAYKSYTSKKYNEDAQTFLTGKLDVDSVIEPDDFSDAFTKAYILTAVKYANGFGEVKEVLKDYGDIIGINGTTDDAVYKEMSGKTYSDTNELKSSYESLKKEYDDDSSGSGSSAGGNNGGGGSKVNMSGSYSGGMTTTQKPSAVYASFNDIDAVDWAAEAIIALADKGIINGVGDGNFKPDLNITREEFAKILVCACGYENESVGVNAFEDVADDDWFFKYVNIAYQKKLVNGVGGGMFGSGQNISRQDMAVMIYNALIAKGAEPEAGELVFDDSDMIEDYAKTAVASLYKMNVINGVSETEFDPVGNATRAQAAKMIYGVYNELNR